MKTFYPGLATSPLWTWLTRLERQGTGRRRWPPTKCPSWASVLTTQSSTSCIWMLGRESSSPLSPRQEEGTCSVTFIQVCLKGKFSEHYQELFSYEEDYTFLHWDFHVIQRHNIFQGTTTLFWRTSELLARLSTAAFKWQSGNTFHVLIPHLYHVHFISQRQGSYQDTGAGPGPGATEALAQ